MSSSPSHDSGTEFSSNVPTEQGPGLAAGEARKTAKEVPRGPLLGLALLAAAVAATASWGLDEAGLFRFRPAIENLSMMGHAYQDASPRTRELATLKGASCLLGSFGALLGVGMGLVGGQSSRRRRQALIAAGVGLLAGGIAGAAPLWTVIAAYNRAEELGAGGIGRSLLMHWALWTALGAAAGLALGIGIGDRTRLLAALFGGAIGAMVGTFAYELVGALVFPLAETGKPISETSATRLMAMLFIAVSSSLGAILVSQPKMVSARKKVSGTVDDPAGK